MSDDIGLRISEVTSKIIAEIPDRLNIVGILRAAHDQITLAASHDGTILPSDVVAEKVVEVLREIAAHAVGEFERRTGQQFLWVDEPEEPEEMIMSIGVEVKDGKGYVTF